MKKEIKVGKNIFKFEFVPPPAPIENSVKEALENWCKLTEECKIKEEVWTEIPLLPGYKFKNLRLKTSSDFIITGEESPIVTNVNFTCDKFEKLL